MRTPRFTCLLLPLLLIGLAACSSNRTAPTPQLTDNAWQLVSLESDSVIEGSLITAEFSRAEFALEGVVRGTAGCNTYSANYRDDDQALTVGPTAAATRMICPDPPGVMEQEARYLQLLPSAATWYITGERLELRNVVGHILLTFEVLRPVPPGGDQ